MTFFLARRQRFLEQLFHCRHNFHRQEAFRPSPSRQLHCRQDQVRAALSLREKNGQEAFRPLSIRQPHCRVGQVRVVLSQQEKSEPRSSLSGQTRDCVTLRFFGVACEISQQVHSIFLSESNLVPSEPRVVMDEVGEVRIVHDIEMTSIVQLHFLGGSPKQSVLTQNVELTRPVSGFCPRPKHGR